MPKFIIPAELHPGVYRPETGLYKPHQTMEWPDADTARLAESNYEEKPHWLLEPVDEEGYELLKSHHPDKDIARPAGMPEPKSTAPKPQTPKQAVKEYAPPEDEGEPVTEKPKKKTRRRAADSE